MAKYQWVDETSYRRDERGKVEPRAWGIEQLQLRIHGLHGADGVLFFSARDDGVSARELAAKDVESAKVEALRELHQIRAQRLDDVVAAMKDLA